MNVLRCEICGCGYLSQDSRKIVFYHVVHGVDKRNTTNCCPKCYEIIKQLDTQRLRKD